MESLASDLGLADLYKQATKGKTPQEIIKTVRELQDGEIGK